MGSNQHHNRKSIAIPDAAGLSTAAAMFTFGVSMSLPWRKAPLIGVDSKVNEVPAPRRRRSRGGK